MRTTLLLCTKVTMLNGTEDIMRLLLKRTTAIDPADNSKWTALHWAVAFDQNEMVEMHLVEGANVNAGDSPNPLPQPSPP
ncbi:hypothetical protein F4781DRAFT_408927 [Annulohypoxylon bovei var. microspora]|nr:hypothetical protein F4781DRAFT_408927 [Annulohypoxylon bovei var. microspora]